MRNLKKVLAVILTVAMLASFMVPAFAAVSHLDEAKKLQTIGLFAGGEADLKLDEDVTRIQGLTFAIRAAGKEDEALAMTDEEVAAELAKFNDAADIPSWNGNGPKYVAYAIKNGITVGDGQGNFKPLDKVSGRAFLVFLLKSGMGYADVTTLTAPDVAVEAGVLTPSQAMAYAAAESGIIRDDAAAILYGAAMYGENADGVKFIEALIESGFVSKDAAVEAGFVDAEPEDLEVVSVEAINLKQIVVELSNTDYDEDEVKKETNYKFKGVVSKKDKTIAISDASVDGTTLTLTLAEAVDNQSEGDLTIKKDVIGEEVEFEDIEFFDTTIPEIVDAEVVGKDTVKVKFSEPINFEEAGDPLEAAAKYEKEFTFKLNGKSYSVDKIFVLDNGATANVKVFGTFKDGTLTMKVGNGLEDYAGFNLVSRTIEMDVEEDTEAPYVVGYEAKNRNEVTLIFNEDIELKKTGTADFYHTNSSNTNNGVSVKGNELKITFTTNKLPEGAAYIYIKSEAIADLWANKNESTIKYLVNVTIDEDAPEVSEIKATSTEIKITFNEKLDEASAKKVANYTILDEDGDKVSIRTPVYSENDDDEGVVTLTPRTALEDGVYTIEIKNVEDTSNNVMDDFSDSFTLDDETPPTVLGPNKAYLSVVDFADKEYEITILFSEGMETEGKYSVLDLANYTIFVSGKGMKTLEWVNDQDDYSVEIEAIDGDETVVITIEGLALAKNTAGAGEDPIYAVADAYAATGQFVVGRVADAEGNYSDAYSTDLTFAMKSSEVIYLDSAKATDKKTVEVKFASNLQNPEVQDFAIVSQDGNEEFAIESLDIIDADEIVLNLADELPADVLGDDNAKLIVLTSDDPDSENNSGISLAAGDYVEIADKIAPSVLLEDNVKSDLIYELRDPGNGDDDEVPAVYAEYTAATTSSAITIIFDENIASYINNNIGLFKVNDGDNKVTNVVVSGATVTLTVEGEVIKGDSIDITVIYDEFNNSTENLALNIEYLVKQL